jgi:predicted dehydrogenase
MQQLPTITGRPIRAGLVGCGRVSNNHFGSIEQQARHMRLAAVRDVDPTWHRSDKPQIRFHLQRSTRKPWPPKPQDNLH